MHHGELLWLAMVLMWSQVTEVAASPWPLGNALFDALNVSDVKFTQDVLWEKPVKSRDKCALMCVDEAHCGTFTFTPSTDGPGGSCRIHGKRQSSLGEQEDASGAYSFVRVIKEFWIQKACTTSSDCTEPMAACYSGQCLCDGGFFFDYYQNACESKCTRSLGDTYVQYVNMTLYNHTVDHVSAYGDGTTCQPKCTADPKCTGFTAGTQAGWCNYKHATAQDFPQDWIAWHPRIYHQRTCK